MRHAVQVDLLERLLSQAEGGAAGFQESDVPVDRYVSEARLADEMRVLFREYPLIVAHASELARPGDFVTHDATGIPILVTRDAGARLHAFLNVCRHRGARLVNERSGHRKAFVCPYHAWTYGGGGALTHVPMKELFPKLACEDHALVPLPVESRHGFVWVTPQRERTRELGPFLGGLEDDLAAFGLETHRLYRRTERRRKANWKLVIDAFTEGYHARFLHQKSVARFFSTEAVSDAFAPHSRSVGARANVQDARSRPRSEWRLRDFATPFYYLFPNTILVFHPDYLSQISVFPDGTDALSYAHSMIIPEEPKSDDDRRHWEKTFELIEETVFQREDLAIAESVQSGLRSGANTRFQLGGLEQPVGWFHRAIEEALAKGP